ncbi:hypothetical protein G7Z17_g1332 [Cylindrodendrum hubeiense]|uniref:Carbonic anhydrase n=1 Tax=Cylindrodendrum hubeiense TaxID=595255 RepID=A0A9P5LFF1_9HYPO|nr:hypothetical protein G7Z17_g1332 [Cylindrodendrum hubeiense]
MANIETLLARNKTISHTPLPYISEIQASGAPPARTLIVTCVDPRCVPEKFFNLNAGEVGVHRNAGGNIRHALRDINILDTMFKLEEIAIIHHTDCGTTHFTDEQVRAGLKSHMDKAHWDDIEKMGFEPNTDETSSIEQSVKGDLEWVQASPFIREELKKGTRGFVFDIKTGTLEEVKKA